jgi:predicted dehydrogenase
MNNHQNNGQCISWGIIGCGNVTELKSGPAFNKVPDSRLHAVMRRDALKAEDYAARHGVPVWYSNAHSLINDSAINAIYVATPPKFHEEYAIAALEKGKAVYVEKPVAVSVAASKRMADAVIANNGKLVVAHYRRGLPMFLKIKELVETGAVGKVKNIRLTMFQTHRTDIFMIWHHTSSTSSSLFLVKPFARPVPPHIKPIFMQRKMQYLESWSFPTIFCFRAIGISQCQTS